MADPSTTPEQAQLAFYERNKAGCAFAAYAAKDPARFGWRQRLLAPEPDLVDAAIQETITDAGTSMVSLIFPEVREPESLLRLCRCLSACELVHLGQDTVFDGCRCLGFRARVRELESWMSGFGPFAFLPKTRQAPYTEVAFRVKPRPLYKRVMKKSPPGVIHLADLDMLGIADTLFKKLWYSSLDRTAQILGHRPDLRSAAKTTFAIPEPLFPENNRADG